MLAQALVSFRRQDVVVLGLPRSGVPGVDVVARALGAPLEVLVVRKLGVPYQPELAMGRNRRGDVRVLNESVLCDWRLTEQDIARAEAKERDTLAHRISTLRGGHELGVMVPVPAEACSDCAKGRACVAHSRLPQHRETRQRETPCESA